MNIIIERMRNFLIEEDGPAAVEYAVMLALIIIVAATAIQSLGTQTSATFNTLTTQLSSSS